MAPEHHTQNPDRRKLLSVVPPRVQAVPDRVGDTKRARRRSPTRHLTIDQFVGLLAVIEDVGGIATLDEISRAMPAVERPVSAVFDLCDAEILCADWESAFDADMRVWRIDR